MTETLRITGIHARGRHGASPGERDAPQPFVVDLEIEVDAQGDDLQATSDYRAAVEAVRRVVELESYALVETMARRIASLVAESPGVVVCRAVVHKPEAAQRLGAQDVAAEATAGGESAAQ
jgi:dihydroneopterin aldolase